MKYKTLKKIWDFIVHEDSLASWIVNVVLAFVIVKYLVYPGLGLILGTSFPIVAVVSGSMEHHPSDFNNWWEANKNWYEEKNFTKEQFEDFPLRDGFLKGDIMILYGVEPKDIKTGQVVVYETPSYNNPVIHRVVKTREEKGVYYFMTKGDNNNNADPGEINGEQVSRTGKAVARIPLLGWIKIGFVGLIERLS